MTYSSFVIDFLCGHVLTPEPSEAECSDWEGSEDEVLRVHDDDPRFCSANVARMKAFLDTLPPGTIHPKWYWTPLPECAVITPDDPEYLALYRADNPGPSRRLSFGLVEDPPVDRISERWVAMSSDDEAD